MKRRRFLVGVMFLLVPLLLAGCGVPQEQYVAVVSDLSKTQNELQSTKAELTTVQSELETTQSLLESTKTYVAIKESELKATKAEKTALLTENESLAEEKSSLQVDLSIAQSETQAYRERVTTLESVLSDSEARLDNILAITVNQNYDWTYRGSPWEWDLPISLTTYVEYQERPRPLLESDWVEMATEITSGFYINEMAQQIADAAQQEGFNAIQKLDFVVAFVQSFPYTVDSETKPYDEYPRYPIETIFDRGGDCEDTSILVAALLDRLGYDVALLFLEDAAHVAVGVSVPGIYGTYYEEDGKWYYYIETTGEGWAVGEIPPSITETFAYVYPLRS